MFENTHQAILAIMTFTNGKRYRKRPIKTSFILIQAIKQVHTSKNETHFIFIELNSTKPIYI